MYKAYARLYVKGKPVGKKHVVASGKTYVKTRIQGDKTLEKKYDPKYKGTPYAKTHQWRVVEVKTKSSPRRSGLFNGGSSMGGFFR